jgi:alpha-glucosidase
MRSTILALIVSTVSTFAQTNWNVLASPDGRLEISFATVSTNHPGTEGGQLVYAVSFQGKPVVDASEMNLDLEGQPPLGKNVRIVNVSRSTTDETYHLVTGKVSEARDHHNALKLELEETESPNRKLEIEARAFDDAVAFRYVVPEQPNLSEFRLTREQTEFRFSKDAMTYSLELPNFRSMYESELIKLPISAMCNQGGVRSEVLCGLPMLLEVPGIAWVAIMDADLRDYSSMYLVSASP